MAKVLADWSYPYQFVFVQNAGHCDRAKKEPLLAEGLAAGAGRVGDCTVFRAVQRK
jgi:hypothetical protein